MNVRLRFTKLDSTVDTNDQISYRRKSDTQMKRDRERAMCHRSTLAGVDATSQASADAKVDVELPRVSEEYSLSATAPVFTPVSTDLLQALETPESNTIQ